MIIFITCNSNCVPLLEIIVDLSLGFPINNLISLVPLFKGLCSQIYVDLSSRFFFLSCFCRNRIDDLGIDSPTL